MPDSGCLFLSLGSVALGVVLFLYPHTLAKASGVLNKTLLALDEMLLRSRYFMGLLAFAASYAFFRLAFLLPDLR